MAFFDNMKISGKAITPIFLIAALLVILIALAAVTNMNQTQSYGDMINRVDPALVKSVRTGRLINSLAYKVYRAITYAGTTTGHEAFGETFQTEFDTVDKNLVDLQTDLPAYAEDFKKITDEYADFRSSLQYLFGTAMATDGLVAGTKGSAEQIDLGAKLIQSMMPIDGKLDQLLQHYVEVNDRIIADNQQRSAGLTNTAQMSLAAILALGCASVFGGLGIAIVMTNRFIARPINALKNVMGDLALGKLDTEVPGVKRKDEIGQMAKAVEVFKQAGLDKIRLEQDAETNRSQAEKDRLAAEAHKARQEAEKARQVQQQSEAVAAISDGLGRVAQGDLTVRIETAFDGELDTLRHAFNDAISKFADIIGHLRETSTALKTATGEILSGANDLAERTTRQAAAIEETTAAIEQLSNTVNENAKRAADASSMSRTVSTTAEETGEVMERSNEAMERISTSSAKISNIIGMIDDIAFQTNLLALNASVEAARAGDAGKGFAVVAVEVRRLAQSAAQASSDVKALIEQSASEVVSGSRLVADATQKLVAMVGAVKDSATLIQDIAAASQEQAGAIGQVSTAVRQMDEMTQHNAALVEETNASIEQTENQANELDRIVEQFVVAGGRAQHAHASAHPTQVAPKSGIRALQEKVTIAARSYLSHGNVAVKDDDWQQF